MLDKNNNQPNLCDDGGIIKNISNGCYGGDVCDCIDSRYGFNVIVWMMHDDSDIKMMIWVRAMR